MLFAFLKLFSDWLLHHSSQFSFPSRVRSRHEIEKRNCRYPHLVLVLICLSYVFLADECETVLFSSDAWFQREEKKRSAVKKKKKKKRLMLFLRRGQWREGKEMYFWHLKDHFIIFLIEFKMLNIDFVMKYQYTFYSCVHISLETLFRFWYVHMYVYFYKLILDVTLRWVRKLN